MTTKVKLEPPDKKRCQTEWLGGSFMTLGPRQTERCEQKPSHIAKERKPGKDGQRGSMSVCDEHMKVMVEQMGDQVSFRPV